MKFDSMDSLFLFSLFPFHIQTYQLTFFLWTTFLTFIFSLTSHQGREPRTAKDGIMRGQPDQTSLWYGPHLPKTRNPRVRTE